MSLVNDMLRDLDRRRRMPVSHDSARKVYGNDSDDNSGSSKSKLIITAVVVLGIAIASFVYINSSVPASAPVASAGNAVNVSQGNNEALPGNPVTTQQSAQVVEAGTTDAEPVITGRIAGERLRANGFELRLEATEKVPFAVQSRTDTSIAVLLSGIGEVSNRISSLESASVELVDEGLLVNIVLGRNADFVVYENSNAFTFAIAIEGFWQISPQMTSGSQPAVEDTLLQENVAAATGATATPDTPALPTIPVTQNARTATRTEPVRADDWVAPTRTQRALSLQELDRNASQEALRQARNGQLQPAFNSLYEFISKNPEAHQSRNTLITLLYAQQQYKQVEILVDEGLSLAPNQSSYKKIKARMLMMAGQNAEAVSLLRNVPPVVTEDKEYYELLASLYQQTGEFQSAVSTYQELIRTDRNIGRWWTGMGISHESMGNVREAVNSFEAALQIPGLESNLRQYSRNRISSLSGQ